MALDTDIALTTYAEVKLQLGLADDTHQSFIEMQINVVSNKIASYCNRNFMEQTYTDEKYKGDDTLELVLNQRPITALTTLSIDDKDVTTSDVEIESETGILYYESVFSSNGYVCGITRHPDLRYNNIKVTYDAGYILPDDAINRTLPYDLEQACINEVKRNYSNNGAQGTQNIKSWTIESAKKVFTDVSEIVDLKSGFLKETKALLDSCYRNWVI